MGTVASRIERGAATSNSLRKSPRYCFNSVNTGTRSPFRRISRTAARATRDLPAPGSPRITTRGCFRISLSPGSPSRKTPRHWKPRSGSVPPSIVAAVKRRGTYRSSSVSAPKRSR